MEIIKESTADKLYVKPVGRIDVNTAVEFGQEVNDALDDIKELIIDFESMVYISSMGLRILLELQKRMNEQGKMTIINVADDIMEIFRMTGFSNILNIV